MNLLTVLLEQQLAVTDAGLPWQRLFDVALSLGILGIIAKVLWSKIKTLEEKLDRYIEEDRKEMIDVIKSNTNALNNHATAFEKLNTHLDKLDK